MWYSNIMYFKYALICNRSSQCEYCTKGAHSLTANEEAAINAQINH